MGFFLQFISVITFTFGAPAFTVLAVSYWREEHRSNFVFRAFTVICAAVFLGNLLSIAFFIDYPVIHIARALLVSLLPPMMFHLVIEQSPRAGTRVFWRILLACLYVATLVSTVASFTRWHDLFDSSAPIVLCAASLGSLGVLVAERHTQTQSERHRWIWNVVIFTLLCATSTAALLGENPFFDLAPDYLVLLFFAVRLYYTERLAFFDTFVKWGLYFAAGVTLLGLLLLAAPPFRNLFLGDWVRAWVAILVLIPVWLLGPLLFHRLSRWGDLLLHRRFSAIQAEQFFMQSVQMSHDEQRLRSDATRSMEEIFSCAVEINFDHAAGMRDSDGLSCAVGGTGHVRLLARKNQIPFLSEDRRLLETLTANLGLLLQNVRLRLQQEEQARREEELASLASRAELRALRAQINPHFLFNALNAVAGWIRTEPEFADATIAQLAEVFRYTLHRSHHEWVRVEEEVEFIEAYLAVEKARFRDRIKTLMMVEPAANAIQIPAMIIQPLIENAIKHGVSLASTVGTVGMVISLEKHVLRVEISNTGPGFPAGFCLERSTEGHGLRNIADRLEGYYGESAIIRWENVPFGSRVIIELPERREQ